MGILSDLKNLLFKSEAINTNVQSNNFRFANRISIGGKRYNITYQQGMQVLEDLTVKMSYETLKYILYDLHTGFSKRQVRWSGMPISFRIFHSLL